MAPELHISLSNDSFSSDDYATFPELRKGVCQAIALASTKTFAEEGDNNLSCSLRNRRPDLNGI